MKKLKFMDMTPEARSVSNKVIKLLKGASITRFVGRSVGRSVGP